MRILCDSCESAAATFFCAADEAALCCACDNKVHMCNKLASRHVRVRLAVPSDVPRCDICENAPAFFYCEVDGSSLCMQCDMIVHVGGKKTHARNLLLRQRVQFPANKSGQFEDQGSQVPDVAENNREPNQPPKENGPENKRKLNQPPNENGLENQQNHIDSMMIDLNMKPHRQRGRTSNNQQ